MAILLKNCQVVFDGLSEDLKGLERLHRKDVISLLQGITEFIFFKLQIQRFHQGFHSHICGISSVDILSPI